LPLIPNLGAKGGANFNAKGLQMSQFIEHYKKQISKIELDLEHIDRHLKTVDGADEKKRLKLLKERLLEEKYNYKDGIESRA